MDFVDPSFLGRVSDSPFAIAIIAVVAGQDRRTAAFSLSTSPAVSACAIEPRCSSSMPKQLERLGEIAAVYSLRKVLRTPGAMA